MTAISTFHLFSIGIGPSSSHTVGPMRAARRFVLDLQEQKLLDKTTEVLVELYGSLALTGIGHGTDKAVALGLSGATPEGVDPLSIPAFLKELKEKKTLYLLGDQPVRFDPERAIVFHRDKQLPFHPNAMRLIAYDAEGKGLLNALWYSVGGGFIINHTEIRKDPHLGESAHPLPYPFTTGEELLRLCQARNFKISDLMLANERTWNTDEAIRAGLLRIWDVMDNCIAEGCKHTGELPGGLRVKRRAGLLYKALCEAKEKGIEHPAALMEWVSLWALAVNEENAAGGRVVTAPTNGAAGVIPAVLKYYTTYVPSANDEGIITFFLTAGAMGILYKIGASISAAEMGCMGEVGVACSMAAAGLTAALGGTNEQIENAAEIGMEHNLGLTCDPIMGLVQIPCIERNTMGAIKAINASLLALQGDGSHRVTLDQVIATMRQTGHDMKSIYKETSQGGLAVNVPEC